jgi:hypothetical protein
MGSTEFSGTQNRNVAVEARRLVLLTPAEVAALLRTSRKAIYAPTRCWSDASCPALFGSVDGC